MTNENIFDRIGGVEEASAKWGISPVTIKQMCQSGKIAAKKIGNSWAVDLEQPNPSSAQTRDIKIKGIKKAVGDFNNWEGAARIYLDKSTKSVFTEVEASGVEPSIYTSGEIVEVYSKQWSQNWNNITMSQLKSICEELIKQGE